MIRRMSLWLTLAGLAIVLAGCAGLPSSSVVMSGKPLSSMSSGEPLTVEPDGPLPGDSPEQIASGFLKSHIWNKDNFTLGRLFLTTGANNSWHPGPAVSVFSADSQIVASRPSVNTVSLSVPVVAKITSDGYYTRSATSKRTLNFGVQQTSAGWRISSVPKDLGVWLSDDDVARLYQSVNVYYPSAVGNRLVAEPRVLPIQGLATALARAALTPPQSWLRRAVALPYPKGTTLAGDVVSVSDAMVAHIDLSGSARNASVSARSAMWAAMAATVEQASDVQSIDLSADGSRLDAPGATGAINSPKAVGFSPPTSNIPAVITRSGTYMSWTDAGASDAVSGSSAAIASGRPKLPAVPASDGEVAAGLDGHDVAAVSSDKRSLVRWVDGVQVGSSTLGTNLIRGSFDPQGWVWTAGQKAGATSKESKTGHKGDSDKDASSSSSTPSLWAVKGQGSGQVEIDVPWLGSSSVQSVALSPEGQRIALVLQDSHHNARVVVAAVIRDSSGAPQALGPPHSVGFGLSQVRDVVWSNASTLALMAHFAGTDQPVVQTIDGIPTGLGRVEQGVSIASTLNDVQGLFIRSSSDSVFTRIGTGWNSFLTRGDVIVPTPSS